MASLTGPEAFRLKTSVPDQSSSGLPTEQNKYFYVKVANSENSSDQEATSEEASKVQYIQDPGRSSYDNSNGKHSGVTRPFEDPSYAKKTEDETLLALVDQVIENPRLWFNLDFQTFAGSIPASAPNDNSNMANMMIPTPSYYYRGPPNRPIRNDGGYPCLCGRNGYAEYMIPVCPALHCANNAPHCAVANPYLAPDCYCSCKERVRQMSLPYSQRGLVRPAGPVTKRRNQNSLSDTSMTWL